MSEDVSAPVESASLDDDVPASSGQRSRSGQHSKPNEQSKPHQGSKPSAANTRPGEEGVIPARQTPATSRKPTPRTPPQRTSAEPPPPSPTRQRRWQVTVIAVAAALVTICVAIALAAVVPSRAVIPGLPDAGTLTELALPAVTGLFDLMAATTIGWLLGAAVLVPPQASGVVDVGGYRCLRAASLSAMVWAASGVALVPLMVADLLGRPLADSVDADTLTTAMGVLTAAKAAVIAVGIAIVIAIAARSVMRVKWAFALLALALFALVPVALGGHAGEAENHDFAVDSMIYHLLGASLWVGGLVALIGLARQRARHMGVVARRYSTVALIALVAVMLSGIVNAVVRVPELPYLWTTDYGRMVDGKIALLLILGIVGYLHRRRTLPQLHDHGNTRPLMRLAAVEAIVMAGTIGLAAALSRTATPPLPGVVPSDAARVLGFDFPGPPDIAHVLLWWRFDLILGTVAVVAAALYVVGVVRLRRRGDSWPALRTTSWLIGCVVLLWVSSSGMGLYGRAEFSFNIVDHMILAMIVPIFLVLGGPVTLLVTLRPPARDGEPPGLREAVLGVIHSRAMRFVTHPLVALALFLLSFYVLYFTDLFDVMISSHPGQLFAEVYFVAIGYLYYSVILGIDPAPRETSLRAKFTIALAALPFYAFLGLALMSSHHVLGANFFHQLSLPWVTDLLANQQFGGAMGWGFTEGPLAIVMIVLMAQWARSDTNRARQRDQKIDRDGDADLDAYNAMLATMAERAPDEHH